MREGEIQAALLASGITSLAFILGVPLARWLRTKRRERVAAAKDAEAHALIDAAFERIKELETRSKP